jgi:hypothetical protein
MIRVFQNPKISKIRHPFQTQAFRISDIETYVLPCLAKTCHLRMPVAHVSAVHCVGVSAASEPVQASTCFT